MKVSNQLLSRLRGRITNIPRIYFQDSVPGTHLGFPTGTNNIFFYLQVTPIHGNHLGFSIRTSFDMFYLHIATILPTKF